MLFILYAIMSLCFSLSLFVGHEKASSPLGVCKVHPSSKGRQFPREPHRHHGVEPQGGDWEEICKDAGAPTPKAIESPPRAPRPTQEKERRKKVRIVPHPAPVSIKLSGEISLPPWILFIQTTVYVVIFGVVLFSRISRVDPRDNFHLNIWLLIVMKTSQNREIKP